MKNTNAWLAKFIKDYDMTRAQVAKHLCVSLSTVDRWLQPKTKGGVRNPQFRRMPDMAHKLIVILSYDDDFPDNI